MFCASAPRKGGKNKKEDSSMGHRLYQACSILANRKDGLGHFDEPKRVLYMLIVCTPKNYVYMLGCHPVLAPPIHSTLFCEGSIRYPTIRIRTHHYAPKPFPKHHSTVIHQLVKNTTRIKKSQKHALLTPHTASHPIGPIETATASHHA